MVLGSPHVCPHHCNDSRSICLFNLNAHAECWQHNQRSRKLTGPFVRTTLLDHVPREHGATLVRHVPRGRMASQFGYDWMVTSIGAARTPLKRDEDWSSGHRTQGDLLRLAWTCFAWLGVPSLVIVTYIYMYIYIYIYIYGRRAACGRSTAACR